MGTVRRYGCRDCEAPLQSGDEAYVVFYPAKRIDLDGDVTDTAGSYILCPACAVQSFVASTIMIARATTHTTNAPTMTMRA